MGNIWDLITKDDIDSTREELWTYPELMQFLSSRFAVFKYKKKFPTYSNLPILFDAISNRT